MSRENTAMRAGQLELSGSDGMWQVTTRVIDRGVHTKSLERGYLSSSSALEAHYKYKGFVSSIWEPTDLRWSRIS